MTNTANDTTYTTFNLGHTNPIDHVIDAMTGYDTDLYRREIAAGNLDQLVDEEWANVWTQGDSTFATEDAAREHADDTGARHVIRITRDDVRSALLRAFGPGNA